MDIGRFGSLKDRRIGGDLSRKIEKGAEKQNFLLLSPRIGLA
jgi:hypothetical protein